MRVGTLISGLLLVVAGVVFFLINLGYGSWISIQEMCNWWPIILIIIGISLFSQGKIPRLIAYLILIAAVGTVSVYMIVQNQPQAQSQINGQSDFHISRQQYPQVKQGKLDIDYGGGRLFISPGSQDILLADFNSTQVKKQVTATGQKINIDLGQTEYTWTPQSDSLNRWQLEISPELNWELDINTGAIDSNLDLTGIPIRKLNCNMGAGNMLLVLGNNGDSKVDIEAGASNVTLRIAENTGVRIKLKGTMNANNLDELGWTRTDEYYISPNYESAASRIDCDLELSVGNLKIQAVNKSGTASDLF